MIHLEEQKLSDVFMKFHVRDTPFYGVFHHFTGADEGDPHDHPFPLSILILSGGYTERVYLENGDGTWCNLYVERKPGDFFFLPANHVHKVVKLTTGDCWTYMTLGKHVKNEDGTDKGWSHWHPDPAAFRDNSAERALPGYVMGKNPMHEYFEARMHPLENLPEEHKQPLVHSDYIVLDYSAVKASPEELASWECRYCGCVTENCSQCVARTGSPCYWIAPNVCSACSVEWEADNKKASDENSN